MFYLFYAVMFKPKGESIHSYNLLLNTYHLGGLTPLVFLSATLTFEV